MLHHLLEKQLQAAVTAVAPDADTSVVLIRPCPDSKFGDYQTNALMALARVLRVNPRQLATDVVAKLDVKQWCEKVDIAGAGFLNFTLRNEAVVDLLRGAAKGEHLFFAKTERPRKFVVDFSGPNIAKPMHVGHIRSTILGDTITRTLRLLGHSAVTDNHIGDWGTQFGMLLVGWKTQLDHAALDRDPVSEMERLYKAMNAACKADEALMAQARQELVALQNGDPENLRVWKEMIRLSKQEFEKIYSRLAVSFDHTLGESFYNDRLKPLAAELMEKGIARESDGAVCVFSEGKLPPKEDPFRVTKDGEIIDNPCVVLKQDGGANYATTDLATLEHRLKTWSPDEIAYVTDGRQQLHFRQIFNVFRRWQPEATVKLSHVWFGSILGEDGKPFKTRSGETVKLADLLDEAEERALATVKEKNPELTEAEQKKIATIVGIGAIKYADLSQNRQSDYVFSWTRMLAFTGNTAPYLQYAYTRVRSIFRKANISTINADAEFHLKHPDELALAKQLLNFGFVLESVLEDYRPNYLCTYLFELAGAFARFYENCPVLKAEGNEREFRLVLADLTARVLKQGLAVLGMETTEQM